MPGACSLAAGDVKSVVLLGRVSTLKTRSPPPSSGAFTYLTAKQSPLSTEICRRLPSGGLAGCPAVIFRFASAACGFVDPFAEILQMRTCELLKFGTGFLISDNQVGI